MTRAPSIVVVDDAAEVRALVRARLRISGRLDVVGEGASGRDAIDLAREHRPSLMLLDVSMPGMDGLEALPKVREVSPGTKVVMYSGFAVEGLGDRTRALGATAFFEKSTSLDTLVDDLLAVLEGGLPGGLGLQVEQPPAADHGDLDPALLEHLERFREVFEEAAIGMGTMTLSGRVVRANRSLTRLLRTTREELVGESYVELAGDQADAVRTALIEMSEHGREVVQLEHEQLGGSGRPVLATLSPVLDAGGRPLYLFWQLQDLSAQRDVEEQLRHSEGWVQLLVEAVEDYAIFMLDTEGHIASWNAGAQRIKGWTAEEIIGQHFRNFYPPEVQARRHPEHELQLALRDGRYEEEGWRVRKDGSRFWAQVTITAVHDEDGALVGFGKVTRDVTERRMGEERLRLSEQRFRLLVEAVQDYAIFMLDPQGHVSSWNAGAQRVKGWTAEEIIGQHFRTFYPPEKQLERHPEHELELAIRDGRYEEEGWRVRKDGTRFWAQVTITAVRDEKGDLLGFGKVTRDITERLHAAQEQQEAATALSTANAQLEEANAQLAQAADDQAHFLAVAAHELRSPVGVLSGTADTLTQHWDKLTDDERNELFAGMRPSADRLRRLLSDLLTSARLQARTIDLDVRSIDLGEHLATIAASSRRWVEDGEVQVHCAPGLRVLADGGRLAQMVENLVTNAVRHGATPVTIHCEPRGEMVQIAIADSGTGVTPTMRERLFQRFATTSKGGTGLGLYIVRELARAQGGEAEYRPDDGAFVITVPRDTAVPEQ